MPTPSQLRDSLTPTGATGSLWRTPWATDSSWPTSWTTDSLWPHSTFSRLPDGKVEDPIPNAGFVPRIRLASIMMIPLLRILCIIAAGWGIFTLVMPNPLKFVQIENRIPGSAADGERLRQRLECFSEKGRWVLNNTPRLLPWYVHGEDDCWGSCDAYHVENVPGGIYGAEADEVALGLRPGEWKVREAVKYEWEVNDTSCGWRKFDRAEFCRAVGLGRNIMFVGDSLTWQHHITLLNHMNTNVSHPIFPPEEQATFCQNHTAMCSDVLGGEGFNLMNRRSVYLNIHQWKKNDAWQQDWFDDIGRERISILILNRGAWYEDDFNFTRDLNETLVSVRARYPDLLIIFRNTVPGYVGCEANPQTPLDAPQTAMSLHNWENFAHQNTIVKRLVEAVKGVYMDVYSATALRPDGHLWLNGDCLHYCLPGPIDLWMQLLYNILLYT